ncbi:MAG: glutamyl-tRNA reductase [Bacteroidales bacterium]|nr:glutamyl-tRNA reductase [Bacteroidales bacterium]
MIAILGVSHKTGPISVREQYTFSEEEISEFYARLKPEKCFKGLAIISTCNRQEIYFETNLNTEDENFEFITNCLSKYRTYSPLHKEYFYFYTGEKVVDHLFKVVSGIDSMILGEDQIVMQVKNAFRFCFENNFLSTVLTRLFNKSFEAANRVRTETNISHGAASVSSAAVEMCFDKFDNITDKKILIIGAGQTGELTLQNFSKKNCNHLYITNRTFEKADNLAKKYNANALKIKDIDKEINNFDIVIAATSSKNYLVTYSMIKPLNKKRVFVDISVPRNIDKSISTIKNIELLAVDDLQSHINEVSIKRHQSLIDAQQIINEVKRDFVQWVNSRNLLPIILKIKDNFETINNTELEGFLKINGIKEDTFISQYGHHIVEKLARLMIKNAKSVTDNGKNKEYVDFLNKLFEI